MIIRHGDVLLERVGDSVASLPQGEAILAEGEVTGHAHRLQGPVRFRANEGGGGVVDVGGLSLLTHEEHKTVEVPPGRWNVTIQREFTPENPERSRRVAD